MQRELRVLGAVVSARSRAAGGLAAVILLAAVAAVPTRAQTVDRFLASDALAASVGVFNVSDNAEVGRIGVGSTPDAVAISPNGRLAYVSNLNSTYLSVIDLTIGAEITRIRGIRARSLALNADGSRLVAVGVNFDEAVVVDTADFSIRCQSGNNFLLAGVRDPSDPFPLEIDSPVVVGNRAYFNTPSPDAASQPRKIGVLNLNDCSASAVEGSNIDFAAKNLHTMATTPDGSRVIAVRVSTLILIDPSNDTFAGAIGGAWGFFPTNIGAAIAVADHGAEGKFAYVVTGPFIFALAPPFPPVEIKAINLDTGTQAGSATLPFPIAGRNIFANNFDVALSPDGSRLYVAARFLSANNVAVADTQLLRTGALGAVPALTLGADVRGVASAEVLAQPPLTAPIVSAVSPSLVVNDTSTPVTITGSNFDLSGAVVRIGSSDPIPASVVSSSELTVVVPAGAAAQGADLIVTNTNAFAAALDQHQSGILRGTGGDPAFAITSPPTFQPAHQVLVANNGDGTLSVLNISTNANAAPATAVGSRLLGVAASPDGARALTLDFFPPFLHAYDIVNNQVEASIPFGSPGTAAGQTRGIGSAPFPSTGAPAAYFVEGIAAGGGFDERLRVVEAASPFNTLLTISAGLSNGTVTRGGLVVTPDGRYVYHNSWIAGVPTIVDARMVVYDVEAQTAQVRSTASLDLAGLQLVPSVTTDGNWLLLQGTPGSFTLKLFDIKNDPLLTGPAAHTITATLPPGVPFMRFISSVVHGNRLYSLDSVRNIVYVFNFDPVTPDFSQLAAFEISTVEGLFLGEMVITPDGALLYATLREVDAVAVLDAAKIAAGAPGALVTTIAAGLAPSTLAIRPGLATPTGANVSVQPIQEVALTFTNVTGEGETSVATTNTNPNPVPAGFAVGDPPVYYEITTTATFDGPIEVCFSYREDQFTGNEADLRVLHEENGEFVDRTVSLDTANNIICALVDGFSAFVVGLGSVDFLFDTLIESIADATSQPGIRRSLQAKALAARAARDRDDLEAAANQLHALLLELEAQAGQHLSESDAARLASQVETILSRL
jgi:hypothetical protein